MKPYYEDNHNTLYNGDCRQMTELPDESVQCVVTSPPYWGLRKYSGVPDLVWGGKDDCKHRWDSYEATLLHENRQGLDGSSIGNTERRRGKHGYDVGQASFCSLCGAWKGSYGLEPTPEMYIEHTVEILREIKRVLRKDGVVFWNIGDSYSTGMFTRQGRERNVPQRPTVWKEASYVGKTQDDTVVASHQWIGGLPLKPKDLCLIPFRVAIAAQTDGWWVRSDIIWSKPNPMPESVTDRPTNSHEHILMLTKSKNYYWDADAVRESPKPEYAGQSVSVAPEREGSLRHDGGRSFNLDGLKGRNIRSVWEFPTQPYPEAHFAVFPEKLPEICIKAATPEVGCCSKCGAPWERVTEDHREYQAKNVGGKSQLGGLEQGKRFKDRYNVNPETIGWQPTCKCNADKVPSLVLDPFAGAGTVGWVAKKLNRRCVMYELSGEYCRLIVKRNRQQVMEC